MRTCVILDNETTGLDPERHEIWETAVIWRGSERREHLWRVEPDLTDYDPDALRVNGYYERTRDMRHHSLDCTSPDEHSVHDLAGLEPQFARYWSAPSFLAAHLARLLNDVTIVAANPAFDAGFLTAFLRRRRHAGTWHYRLRDIGSIAWGYLAGMRELGAYPGAIPPIDASTDEFAVALGIDPGGFLRHSALGDCLLAEAMLDKISGEEGAR